MYHINNNNNGFNNIPMYNVPKMFKFKSSQIDLKMITKFFCSHYIRSDLFYCNGLWFWKTVHHKKNHKSQLEFSCSWLLFIRVLYKTASAPYRQYIIFYGYLYTGWITKHAHIQLILYYHNYSKNLVDVWTL